MYINSNNYARSFADDEMRPRKAVCCCDAVLDKQSGLLQVIRLIASKLPSGPAC